MDFLPLPFSPTSFRWGEELATGNTCAHQTESFLSPFLSPSLTSFLVLISTLSPNFHCTFGPFGLLFSHLSLPTFFSNMCLFMLLFASNQILRVSPPLLASLLSPFPSPSLCCSLYPSISICPWQPCRLSSIQPPRSHFILPLAAMFLSKKKEKFN